MVYATTTRAVMVTTKRYLLPTNATWNSDGVTRVFCRPEKIIERRLHADKRQKQHEFFEGADCWGLE